jgi:outer membrane translocation and assembly module TamA
MFDSSTFDFTTFDSGNVTAPSPAVIPADTHDVVWDEKTYRKYQKQLKKRAAREAREFEQRQAKSAKLRKDLLKLYRGVPETELAPAIEAPAAAPVKLAPTAQNLDNILLQLSAIESRLSTAQARIIAEYRAEMERQDEEEIELLLMEIL